jgi:hypothetical protein
MPGMKIPMVAAFQPAVRPVAGSPVTTPTNPLLATLTPDRQVLAAGLPEAARQQLIGRVIETVLTDPRYLEVVFSTARDEFDKMRAERDGK